MCIGYFASKGIWRANAHIYHNDKISNEIVNFLLDTGADITILSPIDAKRIGIDTGSLKVTNGEISGIGGAANTCVLNQVGLIFFNELNGNIEYHLEICGHNLANK